MDNRYFDKVINEMLPFLEEQGFKPAEDGVFENESRKIKIAYDEPRQMYTLSAAEIEDGTAGELTEIAAWLFDDTQNAKDAEAVGVDFTATLRKNMGIRLRRPVDSGNVELPTVSKGGNVTVTGLTKKMLDFFPALKDEYKNHIAENGNFLYLGFFGEYIVPQINQVLTDGNKKQIKKLFDIFEDMYVKGDRETVNAVVALLGAASLKNELAAAAVREALSEDKHFLASVESLMPMLASHKKLSALLVKQ